MGYPYSRTFGKHHDASHSEQLLAFLQVPHKYGTQGKSHVSTSTLPMCFPAAEGASLKLTKATVAQLTLPPGREDFIIFDEELKGFGIRLRAGGKRVWIAQYRIGAKQRRVTLGDVHKLGAAAARQAASERLAAVTLGDDLEDKSSRSSARPCWAPSSTSTCAPRRKRCVKPVLSTPKGTCGSIGIRSMDCPSTQSSGVTSRHGCRLFQPIAGRSLRTAREQPWPPCLHGAFARGLSNLTP